MSGTANDPRPSTPPEPARLATRPCRGGRRPLALAATGAIAIVLLTSACTGGSSDRTTTRDGAAATGAAGPNSDSGPSSGAAGGTSGMTLPSDVAAETEVAKCMKARGFTYIPHPLVYESGDSPTLQNTGPLSLLRSDADVRAWRQRYGFGVNAAVLYPHDPQVAPPPSSPDPNAGYVASLDKARRAAYYTALTGYPDGLLPVQLGTGRLTRLSRAALTSCDGPRSASQKIRDRLTNADKQATQAKKDAADRLVTQFTNDPQVQEAAQKYEGCLTRHGLHLQAVTIEYLNNAALNAWSAAHPQPDSPSAASARAQLPSEISAALIDVDCRAPYAELVRSKWPKVPAAVLTGGGGGVG